MIGKKAFFVSGKVPQVFSWITVRNLPRDTLFSALQATVQARQPMHLRTSMTIPHRGALAFAASAPRGKARRDGPDGGGADAFQDSAPTDRCRF